MAVFLVDFKYNIEWESVTNNKLRSWQYIRTISLPNKMSFFYGDYLETIVNAELKHTYKREKKRKFSNYDFKAGVLIFFKLGK